MRERRLPGKPPVGRLQGRGKKRSLNIKINIAARGRLTLRVGSVALGVFVNVSIGLPSAIVEYLPRPI